MKASDLKDRFGKITIQDKEYLLVEEKALQSLLDEAARLPKAGEEVYVVTNKILPEQFWQRLNGYVSRSISHDEEEQKMILHACDKMMSVGCDIELPRPVVTEEERLIGYVDYISELISYISFLGDELDETAVIAYAHGWRTSRKEAGEQARVKLDELAKAVLLPPFKAAIKELLNR